LKGLPVTIYTRAGERASEQAKEYLTQRGVVCAERSLTHDVTMPGYLRKLTGQTRTPTVFVGDEWVAGFDPPRIDELLRQAAPPAGPGQGRTGQFPAHKS